MKFGLSAAMAAALFGLAGAASAQMPADVAATLKEIGPRIEVQKTTAIYNAALPKDMYAGTYASRDIAFGDHAQQKLDVVWAADARPNERRPVIVFVHGGGFSGGDKRGRGSLYYDNIMTWAAKNGMVGVNINYRLAPAFTWPTGAADTGEVVKWIQANITRYGGDPRKIYLWGHSVGAVHVADYVTKTDLHPKGGVGVQGAILTSGQIYDMEGPNASANYYGEDKTKHPAMASLPGLLKTRVKLFINIAELDPAPFREQSVKLNDALCKAKRCPSVFLDLKGHNHISETYAIGTDDKSLSDPVKLFVTGRK